MFLTSPRAVLKSCSAKALFRMSAADKKTSPDGGFYDALGEVGFR